MAAFLAVLVGAAVDRVRKNRSGTAFGLVSAATEAIESAVANPQIAHEFTAERALRMVNPGLTSGDGGREIGYLQSDLALVQAQLSSALSTNRVQRDKITELEERIIFLEANEGTSEEIAALVNENNELQNTIELKDTVIANRVTTIAQLSARIAELEADPQYVEMAAQVVELTNANESLESEINVVIAEKDALTLEKDVQAATITELNVQIAQLEQDLANAVGNEALTAAQAEVASLTAQVAALTTANTDLSVDRNGWVAAHEQL